MGFASVTVLGLALGEFGFQQKGIGASNAFITGQAIEDFNEPTRTPTDKHRRSAKAAVLNHEYDGLPFHRLHGIGRYGESGFLCVRHDNGRYR
jgi:hypothetical protein